MQFYLGTHLPNWLSETSIPLFISHRRLDKLRKLPIARGRWSLDSGGFTELNLFGKWTITPREYVTGVRRYADEIGKLDFAAPQDWMCEEVVLRKTGLTIADHQRLTIENFIELRTLAPDLPFIPVLQGWTLGHYLDHMEAYEQAGVNLRKESRVGVGSVCRRQNTMSASFLLTHLQSLGLSLHGFGFKTQGLQMAADSLSSADSLAWSFNARRNPGPCGWEGKHAHCGNCLPFALAWREKLIQKTYGEFDRQYQFSL